MFEQVDYQVRTRGGFEEGEEVEVEAEVESTASHVYALS